MSTLFSLLTSKISNFFNQRFRLTQHTLELELLGSQTRVVAIRFLEALKYKR